MNNWSILNSKKEQNSDTFNTQNHCAAVSGRLSEVLGAAAVSGHTEAWASEMGTCASERQDFEKTGDEQHPFYLHIYLREKLRI